MDDLTLVDTFDRLVERLEQPDPPGLDDLRGRALRRRHRQARRRMLVAASIVIVMLVGVSVAYAATGTDGSQRVITQTDPTSSTAVPTTLAAGPAGPQVLTLGEVPAALAFQACGYTDDVDQPFASCRFDEPTTLPEVDGLTVSVAFGAATPEVRTAWDARDAATVGGLVMGRPEAGGPAGQFVNIDGTDVVSFGVTEVISGESLGLADRVSRTYLLVDGDDTIQIGAEGVMNQHVGKVLGGLTRTTPFPGLDVDPSALPAGTRMVIQGQRPRWVQPDQFDPSQSLPAEGPRYGATYAVPGSSTPLSIEVSTGVDSAALLDGFELRNGQAGSGRDGTAGEATTVDGHRAIRLIAGDVPARGQPFDGGGPAVIVAVDDETIVQVSGDRQQADQLDTIAAAVIAQLP